MAGHGSTYSMLEPWASIADDNNLRERTRPDALDRDSGGGRGRIFLCKAKSGLIYAWLHGRTVHHRRNRPLLLKHVLGLCVFLLVGVVPIVIYVARVGTPSYAESAGCGPYGWNQSAGSCFLELLTIDVGFSAMPFWAAKLVDTAWDLLVGRGVQLGLGLLSFKVFTNALLRSMEASPAPDRTFLSLTLDNVSIWSVIAHSKDINRRLLEYNKFVFIQIAILSCYVLAVPTLFGTMTG